MNLLHSKKTKQMKIERFEDIIANNGIGILSQKHKKDDYIFTGMYIMEASSSKLE